MQKNQSHRSMCYTCFRPKSSCMCGYITPLETSTKFVLLMHPKEFKKVKNGTGHLTRLSLRNAELFMGINFTDHARINEIIATHESYILYPSSHAINLSHETLPMREKKLAIFIIDSTWACALKMMRESENLHGLKHISFEATKRSAFKIKEQPMEYCLSTIESTLTLLELLNQAEVETIDKRCLDHFLVPFEKMNDYQLCCIENEQSHEIDQI